MAPLLSFTSDDRGRQYAAGEIVMSDSFAKVISFVVFIILGWILRRFGILKAETFHAISGLVLYVTLPCVIASNLNGVKIEGEMLLIAFFGFATNLLFFIYAVLLTWRTKDRDRRDFIRMNMGGYSCGPFAVPYVQAFYPTTGILATCVFDVGNVLMSGGGTYAILSGTREKTSFLGSLKMMGQKLIKSGPLVSFTFMVVLALLGLKLPDGVITVTQVGAAANGMLCMIMIGESIDLAMSWDKFKIVSRIILCRLLPCIVFAWFAYNCMPVEEEMRKALVLTCLAPMPSMSLIYTAQMGLDLAMAANLSSLCVAVSVSAISIALMIM